MIPPIDHYPVVTLGKPRASGDDPAELMERDNITK
ncbi:hypothetical protein HMPREF0059_02641 [Actinomyces viscosus C505]|uniref:Uncharacterized protein n=1 Tax=Actinomyces viscosus C505 TaxID=562973 RepID=T5LSY7_ACTVI|nr:hypothetical protein HMPREF0059_02641 [Actinomyces viscosus C505]